MKVTCAAAIHSRDSKRHKHFIFSPNSSFYCLWTCPGRTIRVMTASNPSPFFAALWHIIKTDYPHDLDICQFPCLPKFFGEFCGCDKLFLVVFSSFDVKQCFWGVNWIESLIGLNRGCDRKKSWRVFVSLCELTPAILTQTLIEGFESIFVARNQFLRFLNHLVIS